MVEAREQAVEEPVAEPADERGDGRRIGVVTRGLIGFVQLYQAALGPFLGGHCRFHLTCSAYSLDALRTHGAIRGSWLTLRRILRCHPLGGAGYDPVPPRSE